MNQVTVRQLEYFVAAYLAGSISRAAEQLFLSQPALSRQIAELERLCGVPLLERNSGGVTPTAAGTALFQHARAVLQLVGSSAEVARTAGPAREVVSIGLAPGLPPEWVAAIIQQCKRSLPEIELAITDASSAEQVRLVREGRLDLALVHQAPAAPFEGVLLRADPMGVALSPERKWNVGDRIPLRELHGLRVLAHSRDQVSATHDRILTAAEQSGVRPVWQLCSYTENAAACALATDSVASIQAEVSARKLLPEWRWVPLSEPGIAIESWMVRSRDIRSTVAQVVTILSGYGG